MKTGLFGGAFDPIHKGHIKAAQTALSKIGLDRVIFIPSGVSPFKGEIETSAQHRIKMVSLAIENNPAFSIWDGEIKKSTPSYTYDTVTEIKKLYPEDEFFFIMGDDQYQAFPKWYKKDCLLTLATFLVVTREKINVKPPFIPIDMTPYKASSTNIRDELKKGICPESLSPAVYDYIKEHKLYDGKGND